MANIQIKKFSKQKIDMKKRNQSTMAPFNLNPSELYIQVNSVIV